MHNDENLEKLMKNRGEEALCISYFDQVIGPNQFYCNIPISEQSNFPNLNKILEFNDEPGNFLFAFEKFQSLNYIFYLDSELARGGKELVMISFIIKASYFKNETVDVFKYLENKKAILEEFAEELKMLKELPFLFHTKKKSDNEGKIVDLGTTEFKNKFLEVYGKYYKMLSPKLGIEAFISSKKNLKKIFIFGDRKAGKSTFLKNIVAIQFHNQKNNDLPSRIYDVIIDNMEILTYDCIERDFDCERCKNFGNCIVNSQGFILIIRADSRNSIIDAKEKFQKIVNRCDEIENYKIPIVIIGNKFDNKEVISSKFVYETLNLKEMKDRGMKVNYYLINIMKDDKMIMKALSWLVKHMM